MLHVVMQHVTVAALARPVVIERGVDLNDQVYEVLKARLLSRELGPSGKLSLQVLAGELGVSRSPVHHALTRLVTEGFVAVNKRRGYFVRPLTERLMLETHDVRCALELFAAGQTVGRVDREKLEKLRRLMEETVRHVKDTVFVDKRGYMLANSAFHEYLVDLACNTALSATYRSLSIHQLMERVLAGPATAAGGSSEQHRRIVEAYESGDLEAARAAIVANIETGKRLVVEAMAEAGGIL